MTAITAEQALRTMGIDPQINEMRREVNSARREQHVSAIVGQMGDHSAIPAIELPFAGGTFAFRLTDRELVMIGLGYPHPLDRSDTVAPAMRVGEVYARMLKGRYYVDGEEVGMPGGADFSVIEMTAIVRMALLGGGGGEVDGSPVNWRESDVSTYLAKYFYPLPLRVRWNMAAAIMLTLYEGESGSDG